jgi:hypothetical protein
MVAKAHLLVVPSGPVSARLLVMSAQVRPSARLLAP